jgi:hypothetical protein
MRRGRHLLLAGSAAAWASAADAGETLAYTYDALGRLTRVDHNGTVNNGVNAHYGYDSADNRTNVTVNMSPAPPPPPPPPGPPPPPLPPPPPPSPPPPPPPPPNTPPTPVNDSGTQEPCSTKDYEVTANDTDPQGDYPLVVLSVTNPNNFWVSGPGTIAVDSSGLGGGGSATYTVRDSRGLTATATLTVSVWAGMCPG